MSELAEFEGSSRRCRACAWPVMHVKYMGGSVDGEGTVMEDEYLLRTCERCGFECREALAPDSVNEDGQQITT